MGLFDETEIEKQKEKKRLKQKKFLVIIIIAIVVLLFAAIFLAYVISHRPAELTITIDGKDVTASLKSYITFKEVNGTKTVDSISIRNIAGLMGYKTSLGSYDNQTDNSNESECYVVKEGYEVVMFQRGQNTFKKRSLLVSNLSDMEYKGIITGNQAEKSFYINAAGFKEAFNCKMSYNNSTNTLSIRTLENVVKTIKAISPLIVTSGNDNSTSYIDFCNSKAIMNGYLIIKNPSNSQFGFIKVTNELIANNYAPLRGATSITTSIENILTLRTRYSSIRYIEQSDNFIVTTSGSLVGLYNDEGKEIVKPQYSSIVEFTEQEDIAYYVARTPENLEGVINSNGDTIIPTIYSKVGIDKNIKDSNIDNYYLLYGKYIPVKTTTEKWRFFDISGERVFENLINTSDTLQADINSNYITKVVSEFDTIGCIQTGSEKLSLVLVPNEDIEGIIVGTSYEITKNNQKQTITLYGLLGTKTSSLLYICYYESAYKKENNLGEESYYFYKNGTEENIVSKFYNDYINNSN